MESEEASWWGWRREVCKHCNRRGRQRFPFVRINTLANNGTDRRLGRYRLASSLITFIQVLVSVLAPAPAHFQILELCSYLSTHVDILSAPQKRLKK